MSVSKTSKLLQYINYRELERKRLLCPACTRHPCALHLLFAACGALLFRPHPLPVLQVCE